MALIADSSFSFFDPSDPTFHAWTKSAFDQSHSSNNMTCYHAITRQLR